MNLKDLNPKDRFSSRTQNYAKYRPSYPKEIIDYLYEVIGLTKDLIIADIGSGTGICTKMFLDNGNTVYGVEPNKDMRQVAEKSLKTYSTFHSIDGSSESTTLPSKSVDIITAAQAFHWFNPQPTKEEFLRIIKPKGVVVLLWNVRSAKTNGFMQQYLELIRKYGESYSNASNDNDIMTNFFDYETINKKVFDNPQVADFDRLKGEIASFSYMPNENDTNFQPMVDELKDLFNKYNDNGNVVLDYETHLYYCKIK